MKSEIDYRVYLVTDEPSVYAGDFVEHVDAAVSGGVTCVQYRDTQSDARTAYARALRLRDMLRARGVPLIVNNDAALALAVEAQGVHVGQGDLPIAVVRRLVGPRLALGLSVTCADDLRAGELACADVIGIGPVWDARKTKADAAAALGPDGLSALVARLDGRPNVAIGGLTRATAPAALAAGAGGLALVSAFSRAADPAAEARYFRALFTTVRS